MSDEQVRWTIQELGDRVAAALAVGYEGPPSGQVSPVPNVRTIRYYAGLGLVDPPLEMRGRTAYYGRRHLAQLVAIKRLQARGKSLSEIQTALAGASDRALREIARLPEELRSARRPRAPQGRGEFWRALPAEDEPEPEPAPEPERARPEPEVTARAVCEVELAPGVRLLIETDRAPSPGELRQFHTAAAPLLARIQEP